MRFSCIFRLQWAVCGRPSSQWRLLHQPPVHALPHPCVLWYDDTWQWMDRVILTLPCISRLQWAVYGRPSSQWRLLHQPPVHALPHPCVLWYDDTWQWMDRVILTLPCISRLQWAVCGRPSSQWRLLYQPPVHALPHPCVLWYDDTWQRMDRLPTTQRRRHRFQP